MREGVVGAMMIFLLDLACSRRLLDEKVRSQGVLFGGFSESGTSDTIMKLVG
jgi:hypothetical protein